MATPLEDFESRIAELLVEVDFLTLATRLRPRLGDVIRWDAQGDVLDLARFFMGTKFSRAEAMYAAVLIRLLAAFERYVRNLVESAVEHRATAAGTYEKLSSALASRNIALTGRILAFIDTPREHLVFNIANLVENLASCRPGNATFRLNSSAFSAVVTGSSPPVIERALQNIDVTEFWDLVGANEGLAKVLGTKGTRATAERAKERLKELWRWRNHLAHGGDEEVELSEAQLRDVVAFVRALATGLDDVVKRQLKKRGVS